MRILEFSDGYTSASAPTTTGITRSSLADGTAYRILANNSSGVMSENAALTAGRVVYPDANGQLTGSANFSYSAGALTIKLAGSSTPTNALIINETTGLNGNITGIEFNSAGTGNAGRALISQKIAPGGATAGIRVYTGGATPVQAIEVSGTDQSTTFAGVLGIGTAPVSGSAVTSASRATFNSMTIGDTGALGTGSRIENPNGLEFRPASSGGSTLQLTTTRIVQIGGSSLDDSLTYIKWNGTSVSIANNGTRTYVFPGGTCGLLMVSNATNSQGAVFMVSGGTGATSIVEIADPSGNFTTTAANAGTNNVYQSTNGTITVENKTGGSCNYKLSFMQVN